MRRQLQLTWLTLAVASLALAGSPTAAAPSLDTRLGIAEGFRNPAVMADIHAGWERLILPWDQVQPSGADDFAREIDTQSNVVSAAAAAAGIKRMLQN